MQDERQDCALEVLQSIAAYGLDDSVCGLSNKWNKASGKSKSMILLGV